MRMELGSFDFSRHLLFTIPPFEVQVPYSSVAYESGHEVVESTVCAGGGHLSGVARQHQLS